MKHRIVHALQKYLFNPPIKLALVAGLPLPGYALLETKSREDEEDALGWEGHQLMSKLVDFGDARLQAGEG